MLYLNVPFSDKDTAKSLGAKWDANHKKWYVKDQKDYYKFMRWMYPENGLPESVDILTSHFYIVQGFKECWKCKTTEPVIGFAVEKGIRLYANDYYDEDGALMFDENADIAVIENGNSDCDYDGDIHIMEDFSPMPVELLNALTTQFNYKKGYSKTLQDYCLANHCTKCGVLQGNFFLFQEVDSPFWCESDEKIKALTFYKVDLKYDVAIYGEPGYASWDSEYKRLASFKNLPFELQEDWILSKAVQ